MAAHDHHVDSLAKEPCLTVEEVSDGDVEDEES
jgi:hypothetical protein